MNFGKRKRKGTKNKFLENKKKHADFVRTQNFAAAFGKTKLMLFSSR